MRLIAVLPDEKQVSALTDSLRNAGYDRKDMIISNIADEESYRNAEEATEAGISMIKTELNSLNDAGTFADSIEGLKSDRGILVAVETTKHDLFKVKEIMEQSGAVEIIKD